MSWAYGAIVDIQHEGIGAFDENLHVPVLGLLQESDGVDGILGQLGPVRVEARNLVLDVVLEQVAKPLGVVGCEATNLLLKELSVEDFGKSDTASCMARLAAPQKRVWFELWATCWQPWCCTTGRCHGQWCHRKAYPFIS